jgi:hypothetical protein
VRVQQALVEFYRVVMAMLIALIVLIAPALTANAITLERERKTMDLLLATPLTARQLLVGKLVGSFAFIVLLLALTLPVSAVSVLLGGVSFPELLKAYLLIASARAGAVRDWAIHLCVCSQLHAGGSVELFARRRLSIPHRLSRDDAGGVCGGGRSGARRR